MGRGEGEVMGPFSVPEPPEVGVAPFWWQVLGADSREPVTGCGRADREILARQLVEAQMLACEASIGGMVVGPGGAMLRCRRAATGLYWSAAGDD